MRKQPTLAFCIHLCSIFIFLLFYSLTLAHENGFYELVKESSQKDKNNDRDEFYNLISNLHSTAYVSNNSIKIGGNSRHNNLSISRLIFHDTNSYSILKESNVQFDNVELMTIKLSSLGDLKNRLDLTQIRDLNQLKYIYIDCNFECTESKIKDFIIYDNPNIRIFYKVSNPSISQRLASLSD